MNPRLATTAAATAALSLALTACSAADDDTTASASPSGVTVSHIHGLGLDPSDQRLYVATHEGVYTPDSQGRPTLVGDSKDDFMGFTVAGAKTFYASGHPAGGDGPGNKGLIKSTDAGRSWQALSLSGASDFHALDLVHDTVYGYDATNGLVRTSKDGSTWRDGAAIEALDLAVSPQDPDLVLATTADGVARSTDGGKTFAAGKQPVMAFLSWPTDKALYGIDASGRLHRSADGAGTWQELDTVPGGGPQALTAVGARHVLVATQNGVYESKDGGRTFTERLAVEASSEH